MKLLTRIADLLLYTSLFTACCATGLCMATERFINTASPPLLSALHILVFGSVLLVYNMQHIVKWQRYVTGMHRQMRPWYFLCFTAGMVMVIASLFWLSVQILMACIVLGLLSFTYSWPLLPFADRKRLREYGWLKILVLTGVWTIVTSILPILYSNKHIADYPVEILLRFSFIFTLCMIFDIRDMQEDAYSNISTLPNKVGILNSYRVIGVTLTLFVLLSVLQYWRHPIPVRLAGAIITAIATRIVVAYLGKHPSRRAYMLLADGVMMLYAIMVLI